MARRRKSIEFFPGLFEKESKTFAVASEGLRRRRAERNVLEAAAAIFRAERGCKIYTLELLVEWCPDSLNSELRTHWRKRHRKNSAWDFYVWALLHEAGAGRKKPRAPLKRAHLRLVRHAHRTLDYDGLVGSMKPVVDALVTCGILKDDSWNVTGKWDVDQVFRPKEDGQLLELVVSERPTSD